MGILVDALYNAFPGFAEFERKTEESLSQFHQAFNTGKRMGEYVVNNGDRIVTTLENALTKYLTGVITIIRDDFLQQYAQPKQPEYKTRAETKTEAEPKAKADAKYEVKAEAKVETKAEEIKPKPVIIIQEANETMPEPKYEAKTTLDSLVNDFKQKLKQFNPGYDVNVDVYDKENIVKSYAAEHKISIKPAEVKTKYSDLKLSDLSSRVTELYNKGYRTKEIIKEAVKQGYNAIRNYNDVTDLVVAGIKSGISYVKNKYNNAIATKLGAREQIISDYLSGKSYKEIKENLKKNTNGMGISDSTICKIMHQYEREAGKKVVGVRKGNGKASKGKSRGKRK